LGDLIVPCTAPVAIADGRGLVELGHDVLIAAGGFAAMGSVGAVGDEAAKRWATPAASDGGGVVVALGEEIEFVEFGERGKVTR